jgi:hypothetical protein
MRTHLSWALSGVLLGAILTAACAREKQPVNQPPTYGNYPPGQYAPPQQYPPSGQYPTAQQYPPGQPPPGQYPPQSAPPATATGTGTGIFGFPIPSGLPFPIPSGLPGFPAPTQAPQH